MMKEKMMKIGNILLNVWGFIQCANSLLFAVVYETSLPFIFSGILSCPVIYWYIRKRVGEERRKILWLIRGVLLFVGALIWFWSIGLFPYTRCYEFLVKQEAKQYYKEHIEKEGSEFQEIRSITKQESGDYLKIYVTLVYIDGESAKKMEQELILYFDRFNGKYYNDFDAMVDYRNQHPEEYTGRITLNYEEAKVNEKVEELIQFYVENDFASWQMRADDKLMQQVTVEDWKAWQEKQDDIGSYKRVSDQSWGMELTEDKKKVDVLTVSVVLQYETGTVTLYVALGEDLQMKEFEVK